MTGYGNGTVSNAGMNISAEIRSVNNRYLEFYARLPKYLQSRELELKELVRTRIKRGKINLSVTTERADTAVSPLRIDSEAAISYRDLLFNLKGVTGVDGEVTLDMLLKFSDIFGIDEQDTLSDEEWQSVVEAVDLAVDSMLEMRIKEGRELGDDLSRRVRAMDDAIESIERLALGRVEAERERLQQRVRLLLDDDRIDRDRLEMEIVLLADKMDITEELVRFRSHTKFMLESLGNAESEGRKLSFLLQEMNREANTISSKSYDADIAHLVVSIKEELERIREQIQNIE